MGYVRGMTQPTVYMIAGPNGAGKTTAALKILPNFLSIHEFVNADEIARGLNPLNPDGQAVAAGRLMLGRMDGLISSGKSFAFETTGASHVFAEKLKRAKEAGYRVGLIYLWLPSAELSKIRVRLRVEQGGHDIPTETIERRYGRGLKNLINVYLPLADEVNIITSISPVTAEIEFIAQKQGANWIIYRPVEWAVIQRYEKGREND